MPATFTNKHNLPESFISALKNDEHVTNGDISVTTLIDAPQIRMLKKTVDYEIDWMDIVPMALGTGVHTLLERGDIQGSQEAVILQRAAAILEKYGSEKGSAWLLKFVEETLGEKINNDIITEQILTVEILGWTISGTFDRFMRLLKQLQDYKTTTVNSVMYEENIKKYKTQLNVYAYMLREEGYEVESAVVIAILKDWSKMKVKTSKSYPKTPVKMIDIPLLSHERMHKYLEARVRLHQRAEGGEHIPCTEKDRWAKKDQWAVKKKGGKRALPRSICDSVKGAENYIDQFKHKYKPGELEIDHRKAESFRCANGYCAMSDYCPQYKKELSDAANAAEEM